MNLAVHWRYRRIADEELVVAPAVGLEVVVGLAAVDFSAAN